MDKCRIYLRLCTHKWHSIARPHGRAMECHLWVFGENDLVKRCLIAFHCVYLQVIAAVAYTPRLQLPANYLVVNMALADLVLAIGLIPGIIVTRITVHWNMGDGLCRLFYFLNTVAAIVCILSMTGISVERYLTIGKNHARAKVTTTCTVVFIASSWFIVMVFFVPMILAQHVLHIESCGDVYTFCYLQWPDGFKYVYYVAFMGIVFFLLPFTIMTISYASVFKTVSKASKKSKQPVSPGRQRRARFEMELIKMFIAIMLIFLVTWLPFFLVSLGLYFYDVTSTTFTATVITLLSNTAINPVIYGYFNHNFREAFLLMLRCPVWVQARVLSEARRASTLTSFNAAVNTISWRSRTKCPHWQGKREEGKCSHLQSTSQEHTDLDDGVHETTFSFR